MDESYHLPQRFNGRWGVCLETYPWGLFQRVVYYRMDGINNKMFILSPRRVLLESGTIMKELQVPPRFWYGDIVVPVNHPDMIGVIVEIVWHFKLECCYYRIKVGNKVRKKRYFDKDLREGFLFMKKSLYSPQFDGLEEAEKLSIMEALAERYGMECKGLRTFSRWGRECVTGLMEKDGKEFVFVPGGTVTLGWEKFETGLDEENQAELDEALKECEYQGSGEEFIREVMAPVREVLIPPMLVGRKLEEIGWEPVTMDDPRIQAHPEWLRDFEKHAPSCGSLNIVGCVRFEFVEGDWKVFLYQEITYPQLKEILEKEGYSMPTADEWAYLSGGGCRTLFPWGEGIQEDMHLYYFEEEGDTRPYDMEEPNFFGLSIAFDPYKQEVVKAETLTTCGGDGGCALCGGNDAFLGFLSCSPHCKPEEDDDDVLDNDFHFYRPVIRVE